MTSYYGTVQSIRYLEPFRRESRVWQLWRTFS